MNNNLVSKFKLLSLFFLLTINVLKAQHYVTIPDTNLVKYLVAYYPSCMSGNQLDTTCNAIKQVTYLSINNRKISDLTGIQYFTKLERLSCNNNLLVALNPLPKTLCSLECSGNQLTVIPPLNNCTIGLMCSNNQLTSLPEIPLNMQMLQFNDNKINCLPVLPNSLYMFSYANNPFKCVSNYINMMDATFRATYPICKANDVVNNPYECDVVTGVRGSVYKDDGDCIKTFADRGSKNVKVRLYDNAGKLIQTANTHSDGQYEFKMPIGSYSIKVDTTGLPFDITCPYPGSDTNIIVNSWVNDLNFNVSCIPGFDVGIQSISTQGLVFPGQQHTLSIAAGTIAQWYNYECQQGAGGELKFTVTGPVTYVGIAPGALTPIISGNTYTYSVNSFGTLNAKDFALIFKTNTNAQVKDRVCVNAQITTPATGDENPSNNSLQLCYAVVNSYDPNIKEVYPVDVLPGYNNWFTYTIHFQNTGNAPAINIVLKDTLDVNLDPETFQVLNYSHNVQTLLKQTSLEFDFFNIQLPDSTSNPKGSQGFVQYRIKPKPNLPLGTKIKNKASIYFDYNAPVVTNTTINHFTTTITAINDPSVEEEVLIYPNPGNGYYNIELGGNTTLQHAWLEVYDILGKEMLNKTIVSKKMQLDLSSLPKGIYFLRINGVGEHLSQRLIKQ